MTFPEARDGTLSAVDLAASHTIFLTVPLVRVPCFAVPEHVTCVIRAVILATGLLFSTAAAMSFAAAPGDALASGGGWVAMARPLVIPAQM
jgi:hypothetical protein